MTHIAVDILGGDLGSPSFVSGALQVLETHPGLSLTLVGDANLDQIPKALHSRVEILYSDLAVEMHESPTSAIRNKANSSMAEAIRLHRNGKADAVVSAGNTGALVGFGVQLLGVSEGVSRPAIGTAIPTRKGKTWMLDMGATLKSSSKRLVELARIGAALDRAYEHESRPRVALLNVGSEEIKGTQELKEAAEILADSPDLEFSGYVEGDDIFDGDQDVIVCDGFSGNIAIKTAQGLSRLLQQELETALTSSWVSKLLIGAMRPVLKKFAKRVNPSLYNGAPLLGLNGLIVKSHGSADTQAFANAIRVATEMAEQGLVSAVNAGVRV